MFVEDQSHPLGQTTKEKLLLKLQAMVLEGYNASEDRRARWKKNEQLYIGNPGETVKGVPDDTRAKIKFAIVMAVIEDELPTIRDYMPTIDVLGDQQNDTFFADQIDRRLKQLLESSGFIDKYIDAVKNGHIYSDGLIEILPMFKAKSGISQKDYDQMDDEEKLLNSTLSDLDVSVKDTMGYIPDPMGDGWDLKGNSRYIINAKVLPVKDINQQYGIKDGIIKGGNFSIEDFKCFTDAQSYIRDSKHFTTELGRLRTDFSVVFQINWNCSESLSVVDNGENELGESQDSLEEKYPNGRCTHLCENTILYDEPIDLPRAPIFGYKNYSVANKLYGYAETELAGPPNYLINHLTSQMADNVEDFGNPKFIVKKSLFTRITGSIRKKKIFSVDNMEDVNYLKAQNIPSSTFNLTDFARQINDETSGRNTILSGKPPTGVQSGIAIRALYEASQTRIRHKITHDIFPELTKIGRYITWLIQEYDEEIITIRGELVQSGKPSFNEFDPIGEYVYDEKEEQYVKYSPANKNDNVTTITLKDTKVNIRIEPGSGGVKGRAAKAMESLELFNTGVFPYYRLVNDLNVPDKAELIEWYNTKNTGKQLLLSFQDIAKAMFGQKTAKDISNADHKQKLTEALKQLLEIDLSKI